MKYKASKYTRQNQLTHLNINSVISSIKKAYFNAPDGQLHYRFLLATQSPKKAPCAFLHMSANSSRHFEAIMKLRAAQDHDCFAADMPGSSFPSPFPIPPQPLQIRQLIRPRNSNPKYRLLRRRLHAALQLTQPHQIPPPRPPLQRQPRHRARSPLSHHRPDPLPSWGSHHDPFRTNRPQHINQHPIERAHRFRRPPPENMGPFSK
jgi:hypothetical protein